MKPFRFLLLSLLLALPTLPVAAISQDTPEQANKAAVLRFVARINSDEDADSVALQAAASIEQHDPEIAPGRAGTAGWIRVLRGAPARQTMVVKHVLADGDLVFVHSHLTADPTTEAGGTNRYDFYRIDRGSIVEHWSVKAPVPLRSASGNSVFSDLYRYPSAQPLMRDARAQLHRQLVARLSEEVFGKRNFSLLERWWAPDYLQHNPHVGNGRAALAAVIGYIAPAGSSYRVVRTMAEGDLALVCSHNVAAGGDPSNEFAGTAVCDLYRVVKFELVEHWDVAQKVPATSANGNSMFSGARRRAGQPAAARD